MPGPLYSLRFDGFRLFLFVLALMCFASTLAGVLLWSEFGILPAYLVVMLGLICGTMGVAAFSRAGPRGNFVDLGVGVLLFALATLPRFRGLGAVALWSDEDLQNWFVLRGLDIAKSAAYGQQPPLHHYLALAQMKLFGVSLFHLRFFAALFGSLAVPSFYFLARKIRVHGVIAFCGAILFLTNNWLVSYSQEAKPYMMAVFFALVWLMAIVDFLRNPLQWQTGAALTTSGILFLHTVGLQPMLFFFLAAGSVAVGLWQAGMRAKRNAFLAAAAISFMAFLPDLFMIRHQSITKGYIRAFPGLRVYLVHLWEGLPSYLLQVREVLEGNVWLYPLAALGAALALIQLRREGRPEAAPITAALSLRGMIFFPLALYAFFGLFVKVQIQPYYLILLWPLSFLAIVSSAECVRVECARRLRFNHAPALFAIAAAGTSFLSYAEIRKSSVKIEERNMPGIYQYWRDHAEEKSLAFYFTLNELPPNPSISPQIGFPGTDYYYTPDVAQKVALSSAWDRQLVYNLQMDQIYDEIEKPTEPRTFYFYTIDRENEFSYAAARYSPDLRAKFIHNSDDFYGPWAATSLLRIDNALGSRRTLALFFRELASQTPRDSLNLKPYSALAAIAIQEGRCREAEGYFAQIHPLCSEKIMDCRAELRLRMEYNRLCASSGGQKERLW